ncbi:MAG: HAD family hydrolase [Planctomycetota bacterium]
MPRPPFLFDAVVFDLDGTLVATDRFWVDAARAGARRGFQELGIEHSMPTSTQWMSLVGHPIGQGFARLFPDLPEASRKRLQKLCEEEESKALKSGQAALLPGVAQTLTALKERGVRLGVASNCGQDYLDAMMHGLGLARWIEEARCLDSPGTTSKALMVANLVDTFGTRSAVMVGDRAGDRDAAWENGLPHVHFVRGFAEVGEEVTCEASIEEMSELIPRLEKRGKWIEESLAKLNVLSKDGPKVIGITGRTGSGKTLFARDCVRVIEASGRKAEGIALESFLKSGLTVEEMSTTGFWAAEKPLDQLERTFDVWRLIERVLEPHRSGKTVALEQEGRQVEIPADAVLVVQGPFLLHPKIKPSIDKTIYLEVSEGASLRRIAGRDARKNGPESLLAVRRHHLPTQRAFDEIVKPSEHADLVLDAENMLGPG